MITDPAQFTAFNNIVSHESGWNPTATNASSGAYGLVQALPGLEDGLGRFRLEDQPRDPDQVGPGLHELPLRQPRRRLELLADPPLVLTSGQPDCASRQREQCEGPGVADLPGPATGAFCFPSHRVRAAGAARGGARLRLQPLDDRPGRQRAARAHRDQRELLVACAPVRAARW